jgi:hypothetical protein
MRINAETGTGVYQETPIGEVVGDMYKIPGGDGVERPPGNQFPCPCQLQGGSHL